MDFETLDALRQRNPAWRLLRADNAALDRWGVDDRPTRARLTHLAHAESDLYEELVTDQLGDRVRLEQERIDWAWAAARLPR